MSEQGRKRLQGVKSLLILAVLVAHSFPAAAISVEEWEKKSDADQIQYLKTCLSNLVINTRKLDRPLADQIQSYYSEKAPGRGFPQGTYDLMGSIVHLEEQAKKDKTIDLSKIQIEEIIYNVTAKKFPAEFNKLLGDLKTNGAPPSSAPDGKNSAKTEKPPIAPPQAPDIDPNDNPIGPGGFIRPPAPDNSGSTTPPPAAPPLQPTFTVGRIDVSHLAGLSPGDTEQRVVSLYGQDVSYPGSSTKTYRGGLIWVSYDASHVVAGVDVIISGSGDLDWIRSRAGSDPVLDLIVGRTEAEAVALLGPPRSAEWLGQLQTRVHDLYWTFAMPNRPAGESPPGRNTSQTLVVGFYPDTGSCHIGIRW